MESVNKKVILIALIMALFTSFLVYTYIKKATTKAEVVEYINVYVAANTLAPGSKINDADLKQVKVTRDYLNSKAVLNKADIVGKRLKDRIIAGEQILRDRLVDGDKVALAYNVPEGMRAVSINVDEQINVSNLVRPGDFVDVIGNFDQEQVEDKSNTILYPKVSKIVLQNIQVLSIGQEQVVADDKPKDVPKTVALAVTPQDAEKLVYVSHYFKLRLALRAVGDHTIVNTEGEIRQDMATNKGVLTLMK